MADTFSMTKGPQVRDQRITVRIPNALKRAIQNQADRERRTLADVIVIALEDRFAPRTRKGRT